MEEDDEFMARALSAARRASSHDDVPVGCVVVVDGCVVGEGENRREVDGDPTAHAEMVALRAAAGAWTMPPSMSPWSPA